MILSLWLYLCGYVRFVVRADHFENVVVALFERGVVPLRQKKKKDSAYFDFNIKDELKLREIIVDVCEFSTKKCGAIRLIGKYKHRLGLFVGALIIAVSLCVSKMFIWNINIDGLEKVSEKRTLEILSENGIFVGSYIPSLELREIYNDILIEYDEFCWISVNIRGTVANIEVREAQYPSQKVYNNSKCANLVSKYDSEIVSVKSYEGRDEVKVGDAVKAGELLVSGLYEDKTGRLNYCYSQGEIIGRVEREFSVEVPLLYELLEYTGEKTRDFSLKFFSKTINILNSSRKNDIVYDIIVSNEQLTLFDKVILPVSYTETLYNGCVLVKKTRDESTAKRIAYEKIGYDILTFVGNGEILRKEYYAGMEDGKYKLSARLTANVNIAQIQEFKFNEG